MARNFRVWQVVEDVSGIQYGASPPNDTDSFPIKEPTQCLSLARSACLHA
jgi:hypothetical protein